VSRANQENPREQVSGSPHDAAHPDGRSHLKAYAGVFAALLALTVLTVLASERDFGALNTVVAMAIACVKALLVVLYFMHVRWSGRLVWIFVLGGFLFLALLVGGTLHDYATRDWMPIYGPVEPVR
jgi:cytochrome c oxidase subunit 4